MIALLMAVSVVSQANAQDIIPPVVNTKTYTLVLDATGTGILLPENVDNGSNDESGPVTLSVTPNVFSCVDQGPQTVTLTATDLAGNSASADVVITVATSLNINSISLNNCELAVPYALYIPEVIGGSGNYSYAWKGLETGSLPFLEVLPIPPYLLFTNTSAYETPFFNNLLPNGVYNIRLIVTDDNGCVDTSVMVLNQSGSVFDNRTFRYSEACEGETKTYTVNYDPLATFSWSIENGTILTADLNSSSIAVHWNMGMPQGVLVATIIKPNLIGDPCTSFIIDTVTINPTPTPLFDSPVTVACIGSDVTYRLTDTYTNYAWVVTGGQLIAGGSTGSDFATVRWGTGPDGRVSVTVQNEFSCASTIFTDVYVYNNTINLTSPAGSDNQSLCINTLLNNITYVTTGATGAVFSGLPAGVTGNWAADVVTISGTPTVPGIYNYTVTLTGGCGVITATGTINVIPDNTITLSSPAGSNSQTICINTSLAALTYSTTTATGAVVAGLPSGVTGTWASNVVTISGTPVVSGSFTYTVTLTGGCGLVTATGTINVTPDNTITLTSPVGSNNQILCNNTLLSNITYSTTGATGATVTGLPAGVTGSWAANVVTISGTPTVSGIFNYTVTLTGGCGLVTATGTINVTPDNTITLTSPVGSNNQTLCNNTLLSNITYSTTGATGATVTGLPAGVTGSWAAGVVTISGTPTASGTFTYTVTLTGGCGLVTAIGTINVRPDNTIALSSPVGSNSQTLCINTLLSNISYSTTGATGATVTGLPAGVTGSWAADVVTISGTPTVSGIFNYTVTLTGGCGLVTATGTINVTPANTITLTSPVGSNNQTLCINTLLSNITYSTTGATGATVTGLPAGVTGSWAAGIVTISGTPTASGTFTYTVTLTGGCGVITATGTINVTPDNTITLSSPAGSNSQTICINTSLAALTYSTTGATGATVTGLPSGVTGTWASNVVTISGTPVVSGSFTYTVTLTGGCGLVTATGTINVTPDNTIALSSPVGSDNQTLCINTLLSNITYSTTGATGATVTGLPAGVTGSWAVNVVTISGTPAVSGIFNYTVTLTGGCGLVTATGTINVTPDNTITLTSPVGSNNQTLCNNTLLSNITYSTTGATGATVTGLPAGVTGSWAAGVVTISGTPTASGTFTYTVTLTGGCGLVTAIGTINVRPDNTIALSSPVGSNSQTLCINTLLSNITYSTTGATGATVTGLPAGVTGSWAANVVTISGTPTVSGIFNYTVTLTGGCGLVTATGTINVTPANTITLTSPVGSNNQTLCNNTLLSNITYSTTGATGATVTGLPAGVTGSWAAGIVTISGTPTASGTFTYTVTLTGGCGVITATGTINVTPDNTITLSSPAGSNSQTICINTSLAALTYSTTGATGAVVTGLPSGVTGTWASNVVTISGTPVVSGSFTYTVTLTGGCGLVTATGTINVTPDNTIALSSPVGSDNQTLCNSTLLSNITYSTTGATGATVTGLPAGVTGSWAANVVTISGTPTVSGIFNYTVTLTGGCGLVTSTGTINVTPDNTITLTSPVGSDSQSVCINTPLSGITYSTTGATGATVTGLPAGVTGSWAADVVTISGSPTELGLFSYTITLTGGCGITTATGTISIVSVNTVAITSPAGTDNQTVCMNTLIVDITYSTAGASGAIVTGLPAGVTGNWAADVVTISGVPAEFGAFNYTVTLTGGCGSITANGTIIVDPTPVLVITNPDPVCPPATFDLTDPTVTAGSSPGATLSYWMDEAATIPYATPAVAIAGIYYIRAENAEGCTDIKSVTASYGTPPAISADITNVLCHGEASGAVDLSLTGGMAPFEFLWSNGAITEDISGLVPGTYTVVVTDAYGCIATDNFDITEPALPLSATIISQTNVLCFGASTGNTVAETTGGTAPYSYSWNTIPVQTTATATGLAAGIYTLTATDANGCTAVASVTITQPPVGTVVTVTKTDVLCNSDANGTATASAAGGTAPYLYSWNTSPVQTNATASGLAAGTYAVTVTDADGCFVTENVTINEPQELLLTVQVTEASCPDVPDGSINLTITGGTAPYTVIWDDGITDEDRPLVRSGTYSVVVTDANGCNAGTTVTLDIIGIDCLEIPDLFTPNDDGKNDVWRLRNIELYPDAELLIFNRWGRRVYQTKNIAANPWDGKQRGSILPTDSYHYILYLNDGSDPITGIVTLLR